MGYIDHEASRARNVELARRADASRRVPAREAPAEPEPSPIRLRWRSLTVRSLMRPSRVA